MKNKIESLKPKNWTSVCSNGLKKRSIFFYEMKDQTVYESRGIELHNEMGSTKRYSCCKNLNLKSFQSFLEYPVPKFIIILSQIIDTSIKLGGRAAVNEFQRH